MRTLTPFVFLFAATLAAQTSNTGTVVGQVTDASGGIIPGAAVELEDSVTKQVRSARFRTVVARLLELPGRRIVQGDVEVGEPDEDAGHVSLP